MRARKTLLLGVGFLAVMVLAGLPGLGQGVTEPAGELADAECYGHHKQEGFRSMDLFPTVVQQVPKGEIFAFEMTIRNPWLHELQDLYGYVDVSDAPAIALEGGADPTEVTLPAQTIAGGPDRYETASYPIEVQPNATEFYVAVNGDPGTEIPVPRLRERADFDLTLTSPGGEIVLTGPDPSPPDENFLNPQMASTWVEEIRVNQRNLTNGGPGTWTLSVAYRGVDPQGTFDLSYGVYYNVTGIVLLPGPAVLGPNEAHTFTFNLRVKDVEGLQRMRYGGIGVAYHEHTDANIGDIGNYDKWNSMQYQTGATLVVNSVEIGDIGGADLLGPVLRRWSQVIGLAASFIMIPALVFGGTFGKGSVAWMNRIFGGPRRRVLFHNSMSFWLLGLSVLHIFLFLYEAFWNWSHGLVWGGLSLACMVGLGVTGATQRSFVARWGFNRWRFVHFALGTLVFAFVLVHLVADGSHFAPIREAFFGGSAGTLSGIDR